MAEKLLNKNFLLLWQGQLVSHLGNQALLIAVMFWTMEATGSSSAMGLLMMLAMLPGILLGPIGGTVADRHSRRLILIMGDFLRGVAVLSLAGLIFWRPEETHLILVSLYAVALFGGAVGSIFEPAVMAAIPDLVPKGRVTSANSMDQFSVQVSTLLGQAVGGVLYRFLGAGLLFLFDGLTYLFSALSECFIRIPQTFPEKTRGFREAFAAYKADTLEGVRYVWARPGLKTFLLAASGLNFLAMPVFLLLPFFVVNRLERGAEWYGFLLAAVGGGSLVGYFVVGMLSPRGRNRATLVIASLFAASMLLAGLGQVRRPLLALTLVFLVGVLTGMINIIVLTLFQLATPGDMRGRIMGLVTTLSRAATPVGMMLGGLLGDLTNQNIPLLYGLSGGLAALLVLLVSPSRPFRDFVAWEPPAGSEETKRHE